MGLEEELEHLELEVASSDMQGVVHSAATSIQSQRVRPHRPHHLVPRALYLVLVTDEISDEAAIIALHVWTGEEHKGCTVTGKRERTS